MAPLQSNSPGVCLSCQSTDPKAGPGAGRGRSPAVEEASGWAELTPQTGVYRAAERYFTCPPLGVYHKAKHSFDEKM